MNRLNDNNLTKIIDMLIKSSYKYKNKVRDEKYFKCFKNQCKNYIVFVTIIIKISGRCTTI